MKFSFKSVVAGAAALALSGGLLVAGAATAQAATFDPDPTAVGTVTFYNAAGAQIGGGSLSDSPLAAYYKASGPSVGAAGAGYVSYATPQDGIPTASWTSSEQWTSGQQYTTVQAAYPAGLNTPGSNVVIKGAATDGPFSQHITNFPSASVLNPGIYQIRLYTSASATTYYSANILVTATSWTQVLPALPAATATTTTLAAVTSPITVGTAATTLSASVVPASGALTNGSVQFFDGATSLGSVAYTGTNPVTLTVPATGAGSFAIGTHSLTAAYVPAGITFGASTSAARSLVVAGIVTPTTTSLSVVPGTNAYSSVAMTATVAPATAAGSVTFSDSVAGNLGSATVTAGLATFSSTALGAGAHTITATFVPANAANFGTSSGSAAPFTLLAVGATPDPQTIKVVVAPGTLTISTPYTYDTTTGLGRFFDLGTLALSPTGTYLSASAPFGSVSVPADGVTITDTRSGDVAWTASAAAIDFTNAAGDLIDAHGLSFTGVNPVYLVGNALNATTKPVVTNDVVSYDPSNALYSTNGLKGAPHQFASAVHGVGTVNVIGTLGLFAPTSTKTGTYFTTLTFTAA